MVGAGLISCCDHQNDESTMHSGGIAIEGQTRRSPRNRRRSNSRPSSRVFVISRQHWCAKPDTSPRAFLEIIKLGERVIPLMLRDLQERPRLWVWALPVITGENPVPVPDAGNIGPQGRNTGNAGRRHVIAGDGRRVSRRMWMSAEALDGAGLEYDGQDAAKVSTGRVSDTMSSKGHYHAIPTTNLVRRVPINTSDLR